MDLRAPPVFSGWEKRSASGGPDLEGDGDDGHLAGGAAARRELHLLHQQHHLRGRQRSDSDDSDGVTRMVRLGWRDSDGVTRMEWPGMRDSDGRLWMP